MIDACRHVYKPNPFLRYLTTVQNTPVPNISTNHASVHRVCVVTFSPSLSISSQFLKRGAAVAIIATGTAVVRTTTAAETTTKTTAATTKAGAAGATAKVITTNVGRHV